MRNLDQNRSAGYMTNLAARLFAQAISRELRPLGVTPGQLPVFFALADASALSQKALMELAGTEQSSMAETLSRMQKEGLVQRRHDPEDRRSFLYSLTPDAMARTGKIALAVKAVNDVATSTLSDDEQSEYLGVLARVSEAIRTYLTHETIAKAPDA